MGHDNQIKNDTARVRTYEADKDAINERRQGTETQADVIRRLLDGEGDTDTDTDAGESLEVVSTEALAADLIDELGAAAGGPQVDDTETARAVVRQLDYTQLANRVADELEGRMR